MPNHPGHKPGSAQPLRMTPAQLRDLLARSNLTQQQAADLAGVALGTLKQYLRDPEQPGARAMPASASGLLCLSLAILGAPSGLMAPWVRAEVLQALETRWMRRRSREAMQAATIPSTGRRSRAVGDPTQPEEHP
jgi:transcriptional regulator with XRE-family HTH domain